MNIRKTIRWRKFDCDLPEQPEILLLDDASFRLLIEMMALCGRRRSNSTGCTIDELSLILRKAVALPLIALQKNGLVGKRNGRLILKGVASENFNVASSTERSRKHRELKKAKQRMQRCMDVPGDVAGSVAGTRKKERKKEKKKASTVPIPPKNEKNCRVCGGPATFEKDGIWFCSKIHMDKVIL